ncbi:82kDa large subunit of early gene transcription factor VETF [Vaccinia virus WR]|uniref:Early transcription factor 82 kDa subunit n=3 Tax=Vaccinia virus TaxID=10245 RepID=ETF2_VACCW|nr:82kDa large subunit of early gene transcription factor VETF [Vaccinia virus]P20636.3 RecName: Full=Early transcription factor 82 kDa subunit; AltName: Full=ETF large subunit; AltName: Full=VETF A7 subunit; AltName: Full=Vaccinia virus early transcription factor large subunit; Short=VETF large subunit [Vaccinia virus WR]WPR21615.1 early gene transcription factor VETF 82 kDa large subunit [Vaccinia virus Lister]AAO89405.1 82kDa large subunit of early gene transcription factor VETF [Vaccinia vir
MRYIVSPQLVLQVGKGQEVERALYLTPYDYIDEKSPIYYFLRSHLNIQQPEIVKRHILLTLRMTQLKGYLGNLLDIKDDIIIYSHKNNLEYSYVDNTIFNPFVYTQKKTLLKNDSFLYNVYPGACDFLVIWVARACDTSIPEFGSYEDVDNNIIKFETMLMEVFPQLDLDITVESKFNNIFRTNLKLTGLKKIIQRVQDLDINYKSLLSRYDEHFINMTGNHFILNDEQLNLSIWDLDGTLALSSDGDTVMINNVKLFTDLVSDIDTQMERIKGDITYKVHLATPINSRIKLDIETSFIFIETATNNILLSSDKKISIILAKNHISIKVKNHIPNIEKYFTFLVIAINAMFNSVQKSADFTKVETVYWSRICQNTKNKNRKPIIINYLDPGMKKISNNFYKSDEKEVFINDNGIMFTCMDPLGKYNKVGFLNIFHDMRKYCIPCCFLHDQSHRSTFSSCVHQIDVEKKIVSPYILNFGKVVTESKMSFLPIIFDAFLNDGMTANMEQDNKRLKETSGYHIVRCCAGDDIVRLRTTSDIIQFVNEDKNILIVNDMVYFPMNASDIGKKIHILIQEIVHEVMIVKKKESSDKIDFFPPNYKLLKDLFPKQTIQTPIQSDAGMVLTTDGFYIDGKLFNEDLSSKYVTFTKNVIASDAVAKYFSPLFKYVISEAKDRFIKTWMINIMIHMNVDPNNIIPTLEKYYPNSGRAQIN